MIDGEIIRGGARTVRHFEAPTEREADDLSRSTFEAFEAAGWRLEERLWIPGDRRPSLGESVLLSADSENLLEASGTLRLTFVSTDVNAVAPEVVAPVRVPDAWEQMGGVRYRRLAPRWAISAVVAVIALLLFAMIASSMSSGMPGGMPGFGGGVGPLRTPPAGVGLPQDVSGYCPIGYAPNFFWGDGQPTQVTCQRFP